MVEILKLMLNRDSEMFNICVRTCDMSSTLGSVVPLAMFLRCARGHSLNVVMFIAVSCVPWGC